MAKRSMFVGMDVHKETIDISIAEDGRLGEVRHYGVIAGADEPQMREEGKWGSRTEQGGSVYREAV